MQSCCSLIASAAPRLRPLLPVCVRCSPFASAAPRLCPLSLRLRPLQLLLAACVRFSCCSRSRPLRLLLPDCVRFNCCSLIATASTAARPILSTSTAAPRLHASACWIPDHARAKINVLQHSSRSSRFSKLKYEVPASLV